MEDFNERFRKLYLLPRKWRHPNITQLEKATRWLSQRCHLIPVYVNRYQLVAHLYKMERENKPSVWYCMDMKTYWEPKRLKRICT